MVANETMNVVPVTVLTGYLGAGKQPTQSHPHQRTWLKVAVIVNEFGEGN